MKTGDVQQQPNIPKKAAKTKPPKRISHKAARRKRTVKRVISFIVLSIILIACVVASLKLLFIVRTVEVKGSSLFSQQDMAEFCAIPPESNIFKVNRKDLEAKISEEFTYVEKVKVQKKFPDKVLITIEDSVESYYSVLEGKISIYSQSFKFLRMSDIEPEGMLCLELDMADKEISDIVVELTTLLAANELAGITVLTITDASNIKMHYENRLEINLGTMLDMEHKLKMCKKLIDEKIPPEEIGTLDATKAGEIVYKRG